MLDEGTADVGQRGTSPARSEPAPAPRHRRDRGHHARAIRRARPTRRRRRRSGRAARARVAGSNGAPWRALPAAGRAPRRAPRPGRRASVFAPASRAGAAVRRASGRAASASGVGSRRGARSRKASISVASSSAPRSGPREELLDLERLAARPAADELVEELLGRRRPHASSHSRRRGRMRNRAW